MSVFAPVVSFDAIPLEMKVQEGWVEKKLPNYFFGHNGNPNMVMPNGAILVTIVSIGSDIEDLRLEGHHRPISRWGKPLLTDDLIMFSDKITKNIQTDEQTSKQSHKKRRDNIVILERLRRLKEIASLQIN